MVLLFNKFLNSFNNVKKNSILFSFNNRFNLNTNKNSTNNIKPKVEIDFK